MKKIIIALFVLFNNSVIYSQEIVLLNNAEHIIYYAINSDKISFTIEDLKDNDNNLVGVVRNFPNYSPEMDRKGASTTNWTLGSGEICGVTAPFDNDNHLSDACILEVDYNQNNLVDQDYDLGYMLSDDRLDHTPAIKLNIFDLSNPNNFQYNYAGSPVWPVFLNKKVDKTSWLNFYRTGLSYTLNKSSLANGSRTWTTSKYSEKAHPVYKFDFPISEIIYAKNGSVNIRFIILRVSSHKDNNYYGTFYYPAQNCLNNDSLITYKVDLSKTNAYKKILDENKRKELIKTKRLNFSTAEIAKASIKLPEWEGSYIKLSNGKYIELKKKMFFTTGGMYKPPNQSDKNERYVDYTFKDSEMYYLSADGIDTVQKILVIKSNLFSGIYLNLASANSEIITKASLTRYDKHLLNLDGSEMFFPLRKGKADPRTYGFYLVRTNIYFIGETINLKRQSLGNSYLLIPSKVLEPGIYTFATDNIQGYIFEISK